MANLQPSDKEIKFMEILVETVIQFAECNRDDAIDFAVLISDKMSASNIYLRKK